VVLQVGGLEENNARYCHRPLDFLPTCDPQVAKAFHVFARGARAARERRKGGGKKDRRSARARSLFPGSPRMGRALGDSLQHAYAASSPATLAVAALFVDRIVREGLVPHKDILPLSRQDVAGLLLAAISLFVAAGGGIGLWSRAPEMSPLALR